MNRAGMCENDQIVQCVCNVPAWMEPNVMSLERVRKCVKPQRKWN